MKIAFLIELDYWRNEALLWIRILYIRNGYKVEVLGTILCKHKSEEHYIIWIFEFLLDKKFEYKNDLFDNTATQK